MSDTTTTTIEEPAGQHTISGPGYERTFDLRITGSQPETGEVKLTGGRAPWSGRQLQRQERLTLLVDVVVTSVEIKDKLDADGYPTETVRTHVAQVESMQLRDDDPRADG